MSKQSRSPPPRRGRGGIAEMVPDRARDPRAAGAVGVIGLPLAALGSAGWLAWGGTLHWQDLLVLAIAYALTGAGITVGYHRLFTHRSFKTSRPVRAVFAVLGSMAVEGPVIEWVATHRKHHPFSDRPGDPHSPHADQGPGWRGALRGLVPRARRLDVPRQGHGQPPATRGTCSPTATCASSAAPSRSGSWPGWRSRSASAWR